MEEADVEVVPLEDGYMTAEEKALADRIYGAIMDQSRYSKRSQQANEFRVGVSDLGYCSERLRRMLDRQIPDDVDMLPAWLGTVLGDGMEAAVKESFPDAVLQSSVTIRLTCDSGVYDIPGHPDVVLGKEGILLDGKTAQGLSLARRGGMEDQQKRFQRQCYGLAAFQAGMFGDLPIERIRVGNVWLDRSGKERGLHLKLEPLDPAVVDEAATWLDDVVYAFKHRQEARKEPAREVCATTCGFYRTCRAYDSDVQGLLTDHSVLAAVDLMVEARDLERTAKKMKDEVKSVLTGVTGSTGEYTVREVQVNASTVPEHTRAGYVKLDVRKIPAAKKEKS